MSEEDNEDLIYHKIEEARLILESLGMDAERSNERSALVFLALLQISPTDDWAKSSNIMLGTRALMDFIRDSYNKDYAPNSRETIRRFTLHQFVEAHLVEENSDKPDRPINSPLWNYRITQPALKVIRSYLTTGWEENLENYLKELPGLKNMYEANREINMIPLKLPNGDIYKISPGGQNILLKQMVEEFCPRFTPGGEILYLGDAGNKWAMYEGERLAQIGVEVDEHGKIPDLIVYMPDKNWLVLLEAASSHGPVDSQRQCELSLLFKDSTAGLVFVSCFPNRATFRKYVDQIAWESEVWCADNPSHMIHYNGDRFLGPR